MNGYLFSYHNYIFFLIKYSRVKNNNDINNIEENNCIINNCVSLTIAITKSYVDRSKETRHDQNNCHEDVPFLFSFVVRVDKVAFRMVFVVLNELLF